MRKYQCSIVWSFKTYFFSKIIPLRFFLKKLRQAVFKSDQFLLRRQQLLIDHFVMPRNTLYIFIYALLT